MEKDKSLVSQRVVQIPLVGVADKQWQLLRRLAYIGAQYANCLLSESFATMKSKGLAEKGTQPELLVAVQSLLKQLFTAYTDFNDKLSASVRDAINRETMGYWRRNGKKVLRGEETLGRFSANRSLVVRDRGVKLERREVTQEGKTFQKFFLSLRLEPVPAETTEVAVFMPAKDKFKRDLLDALAADPDRIRKATICFKRPGRKVYLLLTYAKPLVQIEREGPTMLVSVLSDGSCWLRCEGRSLSLANRIYRLIHMKEHFARIHARLRAHLGKRGSRYRAKMALLKAGNFTTWALIPLHQLSREILAYAEQQQAKEIHWQIDAGAPDLPWYQLQSMVQYKAQEVGIVAEVTRMKDRVAVEKEEAA